MTANDIVLLSNVKLLLGLSSESGKDDLLSYIIESVSDRLRNLLGVEAVPEALNHIVTEVSVVRYNRIGSEGTASHSVEGESLTFSTNDFDGYMDEIQAYADRQAEISRGKVFFL